ncbi:hypothetical protein GCM10027046_32020 [Uliginosibacterium flavum]
MDWRRVRRISGKDSGGAEGEAPTMLTKGSGIWSDMARLCCKYIQYLGADLCCQAYCGKERCALEWRLSGTGF